MSLTSFDLKALNRLIDSPVNEDMVQKLVVTTLQILPCMDGKSSLKKQSLPSLKVFLTKLIKYTNVYTGTLMATLSYLNRLKHRLPQNAQGLACTRHRILLSCLILSSKYHNDSLPKNTHWAKYTDGLFSVKDINLMERQLLYLLNWDLRVSNEEMCQNLRQFIDPIKLDLMRSAKMRDYIQQQRKHHLPLPSITRLSSASSVSIASLSPASHYRQDSLSSLESLTLEVDPVIEMTARKEEYELNRMLQQIRH